jgi:HK97 family phage major capsid protein
VDRIPYERYVGQVPTPFALYRAPIFGGGSMLPSDFGIASLNGPQAPAAPELSPEQLLANPAVRAFIEESNRQAAEAAIRASNTVNPGDRPGGAGSGIAMPNVNLNRPHRPNLSRAIRAVRRRNWKGAELERDLSQATRDLFPFQAMGSDDADDDGEFGESMTIPLGVEAYRTVLEETGIKTPASEFGKYAVRALGEGTSAVTSVTSAGPLVAPQFLTDRFALSLTNAVVLRQIPQVQVIPVNKQIVELPRESVAAVAVAGTENTAVTPTDPTLVLQEFVVRKQIRLQLVSNEAVADADPSITAIINTMLARDVGLLQDSQYLEGSGSGVNVRGIRNYAGLTTSSWVAATNGSTPGADDLLAMLFDIFTANAVPSALVMNPRTYRKILQLKDGQGRYIFTTMANWGGPIFSNASLDPSYPGAFRGDLNGIPVYMSNAVLANETQGSSNVASHIIYGDFTKCFILERQAVELFASEHYAMNADQTAIRAAARSTVALTQPTAFAVATGII